MFLERSGPEVDADALLEALGHPHGRAIISLAQEAPVDAQTIQDATGMPKSTVYRHMQKLQAAGILVPVTGGIRQGHAIDRYRASLAEIRLTIKRGKVETSWKAEDGIDVHPAQGRCQA